MSPAPGPGDVFAVSVAHREQLEATAIAIKGSQGLFYGFYALNIDASVSYLQLFNAASGDVTVGTTTPKLSFGLVASESKFIWLPKPVIFDTGMSMAATTDMENNTAGEINLDLFYA